VSKVIAIDASVFSFRSAFNYELMMQKRRGNDFVLSADHTYLSMIISCLKKVGVDENTKVFLCLDDKSWRKSYYAPYKAQRKEAREKHKLIDWQKHFDSVKNINDRLNYATPFHVLQVPGAEADDLISCICRQYKDDEVVICTIDSDLKQLCYLTNTHFFSYMMKVKGSKGGYVKVSQEEALNIIEKKVRLGDVSDNILVSPDDDENDIELRRTIINLLALPDFVEKPIFETLNNLPIKSQEIKWEYLPFQNSLAKRFQDIYDKKHTLSKEYCYALSEKRVVKKKKKETLKRKSKKEK
jgi:5'-3' exonuclease